MELHELIRASRQEHELTQEELADRAGVSTRQVRRWETAASVPLARRIALIADALQLSPGALSELCNAPSDVRAHWRKVRNVLRENGDIGTERSAHGLPAEDVRRVAYPLTCSPGSRTPLKRPYPAAAVMTRALHENTAESPLTPRLRLHSIAAILGVDASTITRWARGSTEMKPTTAARVAVVLSLRSWTLWRPPSDAPIPAGAGEVG